MAQLVMTMPEQHSAENDAPVLTDADVIAALKEYVKTPEGKAWLASLDLPERLPEVYGSRVLPPDEWDNWPLSAYLPRVFPPDRGHAE